MIHRKACDSTGNETHAVQQVFSKDPKQRVHFHAISATSDPGSNALASPESDTRSLATRVVGVLFLMYLTFVCTLFWRSRAAILLETSVRFVIICSDSNGDITVALWLGYQINESE